jgi:hypothetical protein
MDGQRSQLTTICPGSVETATVIAVGDAARFGVGNPANVGDCPISINGLDANGAVCGFPIGAPGTTTNANLVLFPGDTVPWYTPPFNTEQLVFTAFSTWYQGDAVLEFDTPNC